MRNAEKIETNIDEEHIVSAVIHVRPAELEAVLAEIEQHPNLECAASDENGKIVLLAITKSQRLAAMYIEQLQLRPGVLSATLIAHHFESSKALDELAEEFDHTNTKQQLKNNASRSAQ